jgi:carbamoyl-phosphate synthase large subunit
MKNVNKKTIAVTAVGGGVGQSVLRALRLSRLQLTIIGMDADSWGAGLYTCDKGYIVPLSKDKSYFKKLLNIAIKEKVEVLISGSDPEVSALAKSRDELISHGIIPVVGSHEAVKYSRDKLQGFQFFQEHNLPFVPTVPAKDGMALGKEFGFPLIIKPAGGSASRGVSIVFNNEQLKPFLDRDDKIIQEYLVPKIWGKKKRELTPDDVFLQGAIKQTDEISIQILHDHVGQYLGKYTSINVLKDGVPMLINPVKGLKAEEIAYSMALLLVEQGLVGPCNLQCKDTERGPVFFEINTRFTGITAVRAAMGFNEVEAVLKRALYNEPVENVRKELKVPDNLVCSRYITEAVISRADLELMQKSGTASGGHILKTTL